MKKSVLLVAMGLLLVNGCSNKTVTPKANKATVSKKVVSKKIVNKRIVNKKTVNKKAVSKEVVHEKKVKQEKQWGAPTISEAEAAKLYGFSIND